MTELDDDLSVGSHGLERVVPERLDAAMALTECNTYVEFADLSGIGESTLRNWAKGRTDTAVTSLAQVERETGLPRQFFTNEDPLPAVESVNFRSKPRELERERAALVAWASLAEYFQQRVRGNRPGWQYRSALTQKSSVGDGPEVEAMHFRRRAGVQDDRPITNLISMAETNGVLPLYGPTKTAQIDAFSGWANRSPLIVMNPFKGSYLRQRFDVAHEIGHLQMHYQSELPIRAKEAQADAFAGALLYPPTTQNIKRLSAAIKLDPTVESLLNIQEEWKVSARALVEIAARRISRVGPAVARKRALLRLASETGVGPSALRAPEEPQLLSGAAEALELEMGRPITSLAIEMGISRIDVEIMMARNPVAAKAAVELSRR